MRLSDELAGLGSHYVDLCFYATGSVADRKPSELLKQYVINCRPASCALNVDLSNGWQRRGASTRGNGAAHTLATFHHQAKESSMLMVCLCIFRELRFDSSNCAQLRGSESESESLMQERHR